MKLKTSSGIVMKLICCMALVVIASVVALSQTPPTGDIGCAEKSYDDDDIWTPVPLGERRCIRRDMSPNRAREKPQDDKQSGNNPQEQQRQQQNRDLNKKPGSGQMDGDSKRDGDQQRWLDSVRARNDHAASFSTRTTHAIWSGDARGVA